jgi:hypothetical protein
MVGEPGSAERIQGGGLHGRDVRRPWAQAHHRPVLHPQEQPVGEDKVIVLTESFWKSHYNEDPAVLDKTMRIDGETYRIIGVAPRALEAFNAQPRFLRPISWKPSRHQPAGPVRC